MAETVQQALVVIDLQNDYFPEGKFPLWNAGNVLEKTVKVIHRARQQQMPVIVVQHIADSTMGIAPFFNEGTQGVEIHPAILAAAPDAIVVRKAFADSFYQTTLEAALNRLGVQSLLICGMMTQNCVTHTAISKAAEKYEVAVLAECCTTVSEILHQIALHALSTRVKLIASESVLSS